VSLRRCLSSLVACVLLAVPGAASADILLTPFAGISFLEQEEKKLTYGVGLSLGGLIGIEGEVARVSLAEQGIVGTSVNLETNLTTYMGNFVLRVPVGSVQPYATAGLGLIKVSGDVDAPYLGNVLSVSGTELGLNFGGGLYVFLGDNLGIRGDLRYFRTIGEVTLEDITDFGGFSNLPVPQFDFWRATAGVTLKF
jgi:opacity protein-like surface antigen